MPLVAHTALSAFECLRQEGATVLPGDWALDQALCRPDAGLPGIGCTCYLSWYGDRPFASRPEHHETLRLFVLAPSSAEAAAGAPHHPPLLWTPWGGL